jgi:hypothetical protein
MLIVLCESCCCQLNDRISLGSDIALPFYGCGANDREVPENDE